MTELAPAANQAAYVEADLNYIIDDGQAPVMYVDWPEEAHKAHPPSYETHRCRIADGRPMAGEFELSVFGFSFLNDPSKVANFYNPDEIKAVYGPEVAALIKSEMGASDVVVFDHTFRTANDSIAAENNTRAPVKAVHNDYTASSARQRMLDILPADAAAAQLKDRFAIVQTWRPINHPVQSEPFALCDGRTIPEKGFVALQRRYQHRTAETYHISYSDSLEWYYFPEMTPDEVLVFKVFDSDKSKGVPFTAHTAFDHPDTPVDARPRESIESRALVFF